VFRELIALVNGIRKENPAMQFDHRLRFYPTDNERIICYGKTTPDYSNIIVTVVNVDPFYSQSGRITLPLHVFGLRDDEAYQVQDLLTGAHFLWHGETNFVMLDPQGVPAHILRLRKHARTERDFDYFM
jgi:starch synthase (maltosyl-transferring)